MWRQWVSGSRNYRPELSLCSATSRVLLRRTSRPASTTRCRRRPASATCSCRRWGPRRSIRRRGLAGLAAAPRAPSLPSRRASTSRRSTWTRRTRAARSPSTSGSGSGPRCAGPTTGWSRGRVGLRPVDAYVGALARPLAGEQLGLVDGPLLPVRRERVAVAGEAPLHPLVVRRLDPDQHGDAGRRSGTAPLPTPSTTSRGAGSTTTARRTPRPPSRSGGRSPGRSSARGRSRSSSWASTVRQPRPALGRGRPCAPRRRPGPARRSRRPRSSCPSLPGRRGRAAARRRGSRGRPGQRQDQTRESSRDHAAGLTRPARGPGRTAPSRRSRRRPAGAPGWCAPRARRTWRAGTTPSHRSAAAARPVR